VLHHFRSETSLLRQVLREAGLQVVKGACLALGDWNLNHLGFAQMLKQRSQSCRISRLPAVSSSAVTKELLDALFAEVFQSNPALRQPLVKSIC